MLKENNHTKPWQAIKSMIDRVVGEQSSAPSDQYEAPPIPYSDAQPAQPQTSLSLDSLTMYPQGMTSFPKEDSTQPIMPPNVVTQPQILPPLQMAEQPETIFNDFNFDNIIGDTQNNGELPQFDFVSALT